MIKIVQPWELGTEINKDTKPTIPSICIGKFILVRLAPPKNKTVREGMVSTYLLRSFKELETGKETETITIKESPKGYEIGFPLGKSGLMATKFRGPKSWYNYVNPETGKRYQIPKESYTSEYAIKYLSGQTSEFEGILDFPNLTDIEKDALIDEYLFDKFTVYGLALDVAMPVTDSGVGKFRVGLQTQLYRTYEPPKADEKWPEIVATKWLKGQPSLSGEYELLPEELALSVFEEWQKQDKDDTKFNPVDEDEDVF